MSGRTDHLYLWADKSLGTLLAQQPLVGRRNLYNHVTRAIHAGKLAGTLAELKAIAIGKIDIPQVGEGSRAVLLQVIEQFETAIRPADVFYVVWPLESDHALTQFTEEAALKFAQECAMTMSKTMYVLRLHRIVTMPKL